jgi:hypothetical protein
MTGWDEKTKEQQEVFIAEKLGLSHVEIVEKQPLFIGSWSLAEFGLLGKMYVFRCEDGQNRAVAVPIAWPA